jgi:hypothetical protein
MLLLPRIRKGLSDIFGNQIIELERISVVGSPYAHPFVLHCPPLTDFSPGLQDQSGHRTLP